MEDYCTVFSASPKAIGLLVCIPTRSLKIPIASGIALGVLNALFPSGNRIELMPLFGDGLMRMRNMAFNEILWNPSFAWVTHMLFVDGDIVFSPDDVYQLINSKLDMIAGCYPKRQDALQYVVNLYPGDVLQLKSGPMRAACVGTGFLLVTRRCLTAITERFPRTGEIKRDPRFPENWFLKDHWYNPDDGEKRWWFDFCPIMAIGDPDSGFTRLLSEDWFMSKLAIIAGIQPHIHTNVILKHANEKVFG